MANLAHAEPNPSCHRCAHYFVTWDPALPFGCRALSFKSRHNPAQVVLESSGLPCQTFAPKSSPARSAERA